MYVAVIIIKCHIDAQGLPKLTCGHVRSKSGNILETGQNNGVDTADHRSNIMAYQIAPVTITLNYLQGHLPTRGFIKCDFLYSFAAVDNILTDTVLCSPLAITKRLV